MLPKIGLFMPPFFAETRFFGQVTLPEAVGTNDVLGGFTSLHRQVNVAFLNLY